MAILRAKVDFGERQIGIGRLSPDKQASQVLSLTGCLAFSIYEPPNDSAAQRGVRTCAEVAAISPAPATGHPEMALSFNSSSAGNR